MVETLPSRFPEESELMQPLAVISRSPFYTRNPTIIYPNSTYLRQQLIDRKSHLLIASKLSWPYRKLPAMLCLLIIPCNHLYHIIMQHLSWSAYSFYIIFRGFRFITLHVLLYDYIIKDRYFSRRIATDISYQK